MRVYKCPREHLSTPRGAVDALVVSSIVLAANAMLPDRVLALPRGVDPQGLLDKIEAASQRQTRITAAYAEGQITEGAWSQANDAIRSEIAELETQLAEAGGLSGDSAALHAESVRKFEELSLPARRAMLLRVGEVTLHSRNRKRNVPLSKQVSVFIKADGDAASQTMLPVIAEHPEARRAQREGRSIWTEAPAPVGPSETGRDALTVGNARRASRVALKRAGGIICTQDLKLRIS